MLVVLYLSLAIIQWRVSEVCQKLEVGLEILGVAAIEDRLQVSHLIFGQKLNERQFDNVLKQILLAHRNLKLCCCLVQ